MAKIKKILVIEDNQALVSTIDQALDDKDYELMLAINSEDGVKKAITEQPNLILLDIMLPGESGFGCLEALKADKKTKDIPVLILSNLGQDHEIRQGMKMGAVDYLVKADFSINEIAEKIKKAIK